MQLNGKKTWKVVFKITEEDESNFDKQHSEHVDGYVHVNHYRLNTFPIVDLNRLNTEDYHTREITLDKMRTFIRRSEKKTPGSTKILQKCTHKTLVQLRNNNTQ